jgi:hypothetical protein
MLCHAPEHRAAAESIKFTIYPEKQRTVDAPWPDSYPPRMNTLTKSAPLGTLGLPAGDHWVKFHVEDDTISFEVTASVPMAAATQMKPTGFVQKWGGSVTKIEDESDAWLSHINSKHLR